MKKFLVVLAGLAAITLSACTSGPPANEYSVSVADVKILQKTRLLLGDDSKWTRGEDTQCDLEATAFTLFCALQKASFDVIKDFQLRRPALEEVRYAIDAISETALDRRLIDFNNLETTDLADIHAVIDAALARVQARLDAGQG